MTLYSWRRVLALFVGVIVALSLGIVYTFPAYSVEFKNQLNYTETEIDTVNAFSAIGSFLGAVPVGLGYDRFGPRFTYLIGGVLLFGGNFLTAFALTNESLRAVFLVAIFQFAIGYGSVACSIATIVTTTKNWPTRHRGKVTGLIFGGIGISAAILTTIYSHVFVTADGAVNLKGYFIAIAIGLAICATLGAVFVTRVEVEESELQPLINDTEKSTEKPPLVSTARVGLFGTVGGLQLFKTPQFYCVFVAIACSTGVALMYIQLVGSVHKAWQITQINTSPLVAIVAFGSFSGRLLMGGTVDLISKKVPLGVVVIVPASVMCVSFTTLAFFNDFVPLLICTIFMAISYGALWPAYNIVLNAYFGDKYHGSNFGVASVAAVSSAAMNVLAGRIYDKHVLPNDPLHQCYGHECYKWTFIIAAGIATIAISQGIVLSVMERRRKRYLTREL
jgi:MFS family permease